MTRAAIGDVTGFSPAAVTKAVRPLLAAGLLRELPEQWTPSGAGRPAVPIRVEADRAFLIGIKITSDELVGVVTDLRADVLESRHVPLPAHVEPGHHAHTVDPDDVIETIGSLVADVSRSRVAGVGIAVSGDVDAAGGVVRFSPLLGWRGVPLASRVSSLIGLPVSIANDVRALTVAEQWFGVGVDCASFAVITVGTGVGCGLVVAGDIVEGAHGVAGELGHLPVDPNGPLCHCGATGCVEALIGEPVLLDRISEVTSSPVPTLADALALAGSSRVRAIFADAGAVLGRAVASVANLLGPQRIVISGELLAAYDLFGDAMHAAFDSQCFGAARECELVVRPLEFEHWARGAASVAISQLLARG
ncbi:MAG TPA: ROK family protein [Jatrophihabitantaceae bacterium]|jgi:predicted NBD/HSP70 family sugar kinase